MAIIGINAWLVRDAIHGFFSRRIIAAIFTGQLGAAISDMQALFLK